jgi:hypothetical protein
VNTTLTTLDTVIHLAEYVNKYATEEALRAQEAQEHDGESELSEVWHDARR